MKTCSSCLDEKPTSSFGRDKRRKDGLRGECRECRKGEYERWKASATAEQRDRRRRQNRENMRSLYANGYRTSGRYPEAARRANLRVKFGMTVEQYDKMLLDQSGSCAICEEACPSGRNLAVDHDHDSGVIRGLLCGRCNMGLGQFRDRPELLSAAAAYLQQDFAKS